MFSAGLHFWLANNRESVPDGVMKCINWRFNISMIAQGLDNGSLSLSLYIYIYNIYIYTSNLRNPNIIVSKLIAFHSLLSTEYDILLYQPWKLT